MKKYLFILLLSLAATALQGQDMRERQNFDSNWQFAFGDASDPAKDFGCGTEYFNYFTKAASIHNEGPYVMKFDASAWKTVDLPHDWVVDLPFAEEASHSHGYKQVGYEYPKNSVGWYRKVFTVPAEDYGKHGDEQRGQHAPQEQPPALLAQECPFKAVLQGLYEPGFPG
jgi:beta-galactosidase